MKLIDKAILVAEIERRIKERDSKMKSRCWFCSTYMYEDLLDFLDTFEVKEAKEPTASDKGMVEEIIVNLKRVEQDYHIDLTREMEWLRSKVQKLHER